MIANTFEISASEHVSEKLFPLEYYANVQATIESTLAATDITYDFNTVDYIFDLLKHFLNLDYGRLYVYDTDQHQLVARYGRALDLYALKNGKYSLGKGVTGRAFLDRQALYIKDIAHSNLYKGRSLKASDLPYRSPAYLAVPFYGKQVSGVVGFHLNERSHFDVVSTMAIVSLFSDWIANKSGAFIQQAA